MVRIILFMVEHMPARLLLSVKDQNYNPIPDLPIMLMNFSANSGLTDMNGIIVFDALPSTDGYVYFYNPNIDGYALKRFSTGNEGSITKIEIVYQTSRSIVPDQTVLTKDFLIGAICNFCRMPIRLGDRISEIYGKLAHYECFLSDIKSIYQKKLENALEKAFKRNLRDYIQSKTLEPKSAIDLIDAYIKDLGFVTQKSYRGSSSTTAMEIWDSLIYRPYDKDYYTRALNFDLVGILQVGFPNPLLPLIIELPMKDLQKCMEKLRLVKGIEHKIIISDREFATDDINITTIDRFDDDIRKIIQMEMRLKGICG
jgi:hypothetical protein